MASFYVIRGRDNGQHFAIRGEVATIGRDSINQIRLHDTEVSRSHARIVRNENTEHEIFDNGSSNGTYVNSRKIDHQILQSGDRVQVGRTLLIYTGGPEPHSSRAHDNVEIVTERKPSDLSQIRSSLNSLDSAASVSQRSRLAETPRQNSSDLPRHEIVDEPRKTTSNATNSLASSIPKPPAHDWEIIYQVSQAICRTGDLNDLLGQVLDLIFQRIDCDRGCLLLLDDITGQLTPSFNRHRRDPTTSSPSAPTRKLSISRTILDYVTESKEGVLTSNAQDDERWENVESITNLGINEAICVPMLGRYGLVGAIYVDTTVSPGLYAERKGSNCFEEVHLKLMLAIASQAALAIEDTQFYRAMLQAERLAAMGQTIANLSHHVKNILQGVRGGSYLVEDGLRKQDFLVIQRGWSIVERNQERISNLVMDMLSFSKEREPEFKRSDLCQLINEVVELMQNRAKDHNVVLLWNPGDQLLEADFDCEAMHRAILNVVTNAIDAVSQFERLEDSSGTVSIRAEMNHRKNQVSVSVEDNGPGIPEDEELRIFSPFESNKGARGTGLGLPVSLKVLREHGGDISLQSKLGVGTTFIMRWPAYRDGQAFLEVTRDDLPDSPDDRPSGEMFDSRATL